jgi:hypothetical protein
MLQNSGLDDPTKPIVVKKSGIVDIQSEDLLNQAAKFSNDNFALSIQEYLQSIIDNE